MDKKNYLIIGIAILVLILIFSIFIIFRDPSNENPSQNTDNPFGIPESVFDGGSSSPDSFLASGGQDFVVSSGETFTPALRKITGAPVSGATIFESENETKIRFLEKATGHIYENPAGSSVIERITNTTIPKTEDVYWSDDGEQLFLRYEKENSIESFLATISIENSTTTPIAENIKSLVGKFLLPNITSVSKNGDTLAFLRDEGSKSALYTIDFQDENPSIIWQSPIKEWDLSWSDKNTIYLTTKATASSPGFSYSINIRNGSLTRELGDILGLTVLPSPDNQKILYSESISGFLELFIEEAGIKNRVPFLTLPEKCVWSKESVLLFCSVFLPVSGVELPDAWYMGKISFSDTVVSFNTETFETNILADLKAASDEDIDAIELRLSPKEDYLIFRNKRDFTPWILRLENSQETVQ